MHDQVRRAVRARRPRAAGMGPDDPQQRQSRPTSANPTDAARAVASASERPPVDRPASQAALAWRSARKGKAKPMEHAIRHAFTRQLEELERRTLGGFDEVSEQLVRAMDAVSRCDASLAALVVAADRPINHRYLDIHHEAITLLASQAPVAGDLRLVAALLHIVWCLERMGDQCVNIAKLVPLSGYESPRDEEMLAAIEDMGRLVGLQIVAGQGDVRLAQHRARRRPRPPGHQGRPAQSPGLPARRRHRGRRRTSRVGDVHGAHRSRARAHRRQHGRCGRADRVPRHGGAARTRRPPAPAKARPEPD